MSESQHIIGHHHHVSDHHVTMLLVTMSQSMKSWSRKFCSFLDGTGTGTGKKWSRKKVPVPVPEKFDPRKKYQSRYRKKFLVPSHSVADRTETESLNSKVIRNESVGKASEGENIKVPQVREKIEGHRDQRKVEYLDGLSTEEQEYRTTTAVVEEEEED